MIIELMSSLFWDALSNRLMYCIMLDLLVSAILPHMMISSIMMWALSKLNIMSSSHLGAF